MKRKPKPNLELSKGIINFVPEHISSCKNMLKLPSNAIENKNDNIKILTVQAIEDAITSRGFNFSAIYRKNKKLIKILNKDVNKIFNDAKKEAGTDVDASSSLTNKGGPKKQRLKPGITKQDKQLANYVTNNHPLSKALYNRLLKLEGMGYVEIESLKDKESLGCIIDDTKEKAVISKFDCKIADKIAKGEEPLSAVEQKRSKTLQRDGFIQIVDGKTEVKDKFYAARDSLIKRGVLDDRNKELISGRKISRKLTEDQKAVATSLKTFGNLSEPQIYDIYKSQGREKYFRQDINHLEKTNFIKKETRSISGENVNIYHLNNSGNEIGEKLTGISQKSKPFTKNDKELMHDLMQYEATKVVTAKIESEGGKVDKVLIDRNKRSEIYDKNFKDIGDKNKEKIADVEITYTDVSGNKCQQDIEVDRGYHEAVIQQKASSSPNMIWVTDSTKQAHKIQKEAHINGGIYVIK
jgi:hypothetical protein